MKTRKTVFALSLCILLTVMISACSFSDVGEEFTLVEYKPEDYSDYIVIMDSEGATYSSAMQNTDWSPIDAEMEKIGFCSINGDSISVFAYRGDSERNILYMQKGWDSNLRPNGTLYRTDYIFPDFSEESVDALRYISSEETYKDSLKETPVTDTKVIKNVMSVLGNESMYKQLDTTISHPTGGYVYSEERIGTVYFYSSSVPYMAVMKQVISFNGEVYYLIRREGKSYICAPVQDTLDMLIAATPE